MEEKRRLPSWMFGGSTKNKVIIPLDADTSSVVTSDEVTVVNKSTKSKVKSVTGNRTKEVCLDSDKSLLVKCETKRKKRLLVENDVIKCHDPDQEVSVEKRKRARVKREDEKPELSRKKSGKSYEKDVVDGHDPDQEVNIEKRKRRRVKMQDEEPGPSRKKSGKSFKFDGGSENQDLCCDEEDDDDDDLTMEDVLSIAKEFVENDKRETGQHQPSEVNQPSEVKSVSITKSPYARSPLHEETKTHHEPIETTSKVTLAACKMTGDPAQDMLELLLGSYIKKPVAKAETSSSNDIIIPNQIKNQQHAAAVSNNPVTLTKKKSSIRDVVAMFLD